MQIVYLELMLYVVNIDLNLHSWSDLILHSIGLICTDHVDLRVMRIPIIIVHDSSLFA